MKVEQIYAIYLITNEMINLPGSKEFVFSLLINRDKIQTYVDAVEKISKPSDDFLKFDRERDQIMRKLADKDKDNQPIIINNAYQIQKNSKQAEYEIEKLKEKYKDVIEQRKKETAELKKLLQTEVEVEFLKIGYFIIPDQVTHNQIVALIPMIKESLEEIKEIITKKEFIEKS